LNQILFFYVLGLMALQAHSKISCLEAMTWRYIIRYFTQHYVLVFLAWQVGLKSLLNLILS